MQIKVISVPTQGGEEWNEVLNAFLRGHKVVKVERQLVHEPTGGSHWSFCIEYVQGSLVRPMRSGNGERKDYRETLSEAVFARFSKYRAIRKTLALQEGVPAFAIFTDEELAALAEPDTLTRAAMQAVPGIGAKKMERYATLFLQAIQDAPGE